MKMEDIYSLFRAYPVISTDTRQEVRDTFFVALKGDHFDANRFAEQAKEKGAAYVLTNRKDLAGEAGYIYVEDTLKTLQQLASRHRKQFDIPVIAITGSNGKTTTKELINCVLSEKYNCFATPGNLNNHIGLPLSLLRINNDHDMAVLEIGANHRGENKYLTELCKPTHGITTNIGKDHLGEFGGMEGVIEAYKEFADHFREHGHSFFLNMDDKYLPHMIKGKNCVTYSIHNNLADFKATVQERKPFLQAIVHNREKKEDIEIHSQLFGTYNIYNILAAMAIGDYFGVSSKGIRKAIRNYIPENNRSQLIEKDGNTYIFDAYNANPSSMTLALESFAGSGYPRKIVVLGDMYELGEYTDREHRGIIELLMELAFDQVVFVGKHFQENNRRINSIDFEHSGLLKNWLEKEEFNNTAFLIKGSRGVALEKAFDFFV